jgi:hypothetical protein
MGTRLPSQKRRGTGCIDDVAHHGLDGNTARLDGQRRWRGSRLLVEDFKLRVEPGVLGLAPARGRRGRQRRGDFSAQPGAVAAMASAQTTSSRRRFSDVHWEEVGGGKGVQRRR